MSNPRDYPWWYFECPLCDNLDQAHGKCKCALFKPKSTEDGVCVYFK